MGDDRMPELATIERLLKERDAKLELIDLLKNGQTKKVIDLLERDVKTINESIQTK
jgi:hypothetical protein